MLIILLNRLLNLSGTCVIKGIFVKTKVHIITENVTKPIVLVLLVVILTLCKMTLFSQ